MSGEVYVLMMSDTDGAASLEGVFSTVELAQKAVEEVAGEPLSWENQTYARHLGWSFDIVAAQVDELLDWESM